jgi:uncharacterized sporulation protein YeaH/YhbH (DUF444 family)
MNIIDRRLNPKGKSLANRQRFLRRARKQVVKAVREASSQRGIADIKQGDSIGIPLDGLREPAFKKSREGGVRDMVFPGNKEYLEGDRIPRPQGGGGGRGSEGSADGEGEDGFRFVLSGEEFLDIFLDDLELPDLVKKNVQQSENVSLARAGYSVTGNPSNLNLVRTMRNSLARRIALHRPKRAQLDEIETEIAELEASGENPRKLAELREILERLQKKSRVVPFIDPIDVRFNRFTPVPRPVTRAVMFCLMDVSGSMTEEMKDLAKRFFMLLYLFLTRRYSHVDIVFIRHTHEASEVDEDTFFYSTDTGGTIVSTALEEMIRVQRERYPVQDWNIYAAQASDGDNTSHDNPRASALLQDVIVPICQYFAYIEVGGERKEWFRGETDLWRTYKAIVQPGGNMAMRKVHSRSEIFPVFRDLFSKERASA